MQIVLFNIFLPIFRATETVIKLDKQIQTTRCNKNSQNTIFLCDIFVKVYYKSIIYIVFVF